MGDFQPCLAFPVITHSGTHTQSASSGRWMDTDLNELSESWDRATTRRQQQNQQQQHTGPNTSQDEAAHQQGTWNATQTSRAMTAVKIAGNKSFGMPKIPTTTYVWMLLTVWISGHMYVWRCRARIVSSFVFTPISNLHVDCQGKSIFFSIFSGREVRQKRPTWLAMWVGSYRGLQPKSKWNRRQRFNLFDGESPQSPPAVHTQNHFAIT